MGQSFCGVPLVPLAQGRMTAQNISPVLLAWEQELMDRLGVDCIENGATLTITSTPSDSDHDYP
jgi:hypothetical protein